MNALLILLAVSLVVSALLAFGLCRAAKSGDERMRQAFRDGEWKD